MYSGDTFIDTVDLMMLHRDHAQAHSVTAVQHSQKRFIGECLVWLISLGQ